MGNDRHINWIWAIYRTLSMILIQGNFRCNTQTSKIALIELKSIPYRCFVCSVSVKEPRSGDDVTGKGVHSVFPATFSASS